jgi:16S rRNA processing protein RimM
MAESDKKIILGKISGVFGVKGWMRVFSNTEPRWAIGDYDQWFVKVKGQWKSFEIEEAQAHQAEKSVVVKLKGIDDREVARGLMGCSIAVNREQLPQLDEDEFYWADLFGYQVVQVDGRVIGELTGYMETGANDVMVVKTVEGEELIPWVWDEVIVDVLDDEKIIQVDWAGME